MIDLPTAIDLAAVLSAIAAGTVAFVAARSRHRRPWLWAILAFLLVFPVMLIVQADRRPVSQQSTRWWHRLVLAGILFGVSFVLVKAPLGFERVAAFEARTMASWFSDHALLAEGPVLQAAESKLMLRGNPNRPIVLGSVGAALGVLVLHRTLQSAAALGLVGVLLGAAAWFAEITSATGQWLENPTQPPQLSIVYVAAAFGALLWSSVAYAWLAERRSRAAFDEDRSFESSDHLTW